jgi:hypothetical protein
MSGSTRESASPDLNQLEPAGTQVFSLIPHTGPPGPRATISSAVAATLERSNMDDDERDDEVDRTNQRDWTARTLGEIDKRLQEIATAAFEQTLTTDDFLALQVLTAKVTAVRVNFHELFDLPYPQL